MAIVILGAGHGGAQLAASLRDEGYVGAITLISDEADLPYHKPPLSKSFMKAAEAPLQPLRGPGFYAEMAIDLALGIAVTQIDRAAQKVIFANGYVRDYDHLVLATGTKARRLTVPGADLPHVFHLRSATDARAMRLALPGVARVVVIGGGFIGLEAAAMLAARGLSVQVVEMAPQVLGRAVSPAMAQAVAESLTAQGVGLHLGAGISAVRPDGVAMADGSVLPADMVVVGIGAVPEVALAQTAGLACDNGILTDALLATSDPHIHAIGDCAAYPQAQLGRRARLESVQNATDQARVLAKTLTGKPAPYDALPWFWSDIGAQKLQIAGLSQDADEAILVRRADGILQSVWRLAQGRLVAVETINSAGEHMLARRLIAEGITPARSAMQSGDMAVLKAAYAKAKTA